MLTPHTYQDYLNQIAEKPQSDSDELARYLEDSSLLESFLNMSGTAIYVVDYHTRRYPFVSANARQVMGHSHQAFIDGGLPYMLHYQQDFTLMSQQIFPDEMRFIAEHPEVDISDLRFSKSYRYQTDEGKVCTILQRNTILKSAGRSAPYAVFGIVSDITNYSQSGRLIHQIEVFEPSTQLWEVRMAKEYYPDTSPDHLLSKRELEILKLAAEGNSSKQIAQKMHISLLTVNTHRRNMLRKTNCQNALELLKYAILNRLL